MYLEYKTKGAKVVLNIPIDTFDQARISEIVARLNSFSLNRSEFSVSPVNEKEAKWLLSAFLALVDGRQDVPIWLLEYFARIFREILKGKAPKNSLGLVSPAHRPRQEKYVQRNLEIYEHVSKLMSEGKSLLDSAMESAEKFHLNDGHIQKIYSALKKDIEEDKKLTDEIIKGGYF